MMELVGKSKVLYYMYMLQKGERNKKWKKFKFLK